MTRLLPIILAMGAAACSGGDPAENDLGCEGNPSLIGQCHPVQGTLNLSADAAYVLWPDDADRGPIKVGPAPNSVRDWPANVSRALMESEGEVGFVMAWVHGTFAVCPIPSQTPNDPENPYGCIERAEDLRVGTEIRRK
jgi:hypothetical protein